MTNQTRGFIRRSLLAVITMGILLFPTMVVQAKNKIPNTPQAVWWDEKPKMAGVARCNEVEGAEEYCFKLYRNSEQIAEATKKENKCDFAKDLAKYFARREATDYYVKVVAINKEGKSAISKPSQSFEKEQWIELFYYCTQKNIKVTTKKSDVTQISVCVNSQGFETLPTIESGENCQITNIEWNKTENLRVAGRVTAIVTLIPRSGGEIFLLEGKKSIELRGSEAKLYQYEREHQTFTLEIDYIVPGRLNAPSAVWWDDKSDKAGVARCSEVEYADEYTFLLYRNGEQIASKTSKDNHCDFANELENYCYSSKNARVYFTVKVSSQKTHVQSSCQSDASNYFTSQMWSDFIEYCKSKKK